MGLPGHRRTSSDKHRRAAHFALKKQNIVADAASADQAHLSHKAAPGATSYRGHAIHVKGKTQKLEKLLKKSKKAEPTKA
ncbi:MAG: 50S ribosomal protein L32 [Patescibacteria group bacterium]|jgi:ribosomal protein L32|nr:50S ribosomal protein L32 [Patescibacteria group bacterium]